MKSLYTLLIIFAFPLVCIAQDLERHVVHRHKNGNEKVVVYVDPDSKERLKEEIFYSNGQLDYVGHYKNGKEDGDWIYYWENGNLKSKEFYIRGMEHGVMYDYNEKGEPIKKYEYKKGDLISEEVLTNQ